MGFLKNEPATPSKTNNLPPETKTTKRPKQEGQPNDRFADNEDEWRKKKKH